MILFTKKQKEEVLIGLADYIKASIHLYNATNPELEPLTIEFVLDYLKSQVPKHTNPLTI